MSTTELINRAKDFHKHAGFNPARYEYKVTSIFTGKTVKAFEIGSQVSYVVANYNSKDGRVISELRSI